MTATPSDAGGSDRGQRHRPHVLALVGPTGVGKTAVAEEVAARLGAEIVSADSMQVYLGMDIGTAKLAASHRRVPHHCVDIVEPGTPFSAALYQREARAAIEGIASRGAVPLVVGGTGLYVRAALDEMRFPPGEQNENPVRERYERIAETEGATTLYAMLEQRDPRSAALIHPRNVRRVVRALELADTGLSYAERTAGFSARRAYYDATYVGLDMERAQLYERIGTRVDAMLSAGLLREVQTLLERGLRDALTASQAIGYKELVPVLEGSADLGTAVDEIKKASRRYAKRQLTWFRADPRVAWIDVTDMNVAEAAEAVGRLVESSKRQTPTPTGDPVDREEGPGS